MSDGGKGSKPRPFSVSNEEYAERWDAIFGRDRHKPVSEAVPARQAFSDEPEQPAQQQPAQGD